MKKEKVIRDIAGCLIIASVFCAGCGTSSNKQAESYASAVATGGTLSESSMAADYDTASFDAGSYSAKSADAAVPDQTSQNADPSATVSESEAASSKSNETRKLITTVSMSIEVKDAASYNTSLQNLVAKYQGYIESSSIGPDYSGDEATKLYQYTIRIPTDRFSDFLSNAQEGVSVTDQYTQTQDVTLTYTDMEAHKRALKKEEETLENILSEAETTDDLIKIQAQLTDVRYQLDSLESQLRVYDNQVDYSTLDLTVSQVQAYSPTQDQSFGEQIASGIQSTLAEMRSHIKAAAIWLLTELPRLILIVVGAIVVLCIVRHRRKRKTTVANSLKSEENKKDSDGGAEA